MRAGPAVRKGISYVGSVLDAALKYEFVEKSGSWFSYDGEKIGQGREKTIEYFESHPEVTDELVRRLRERMFPGRSQSAGSDDAGKAGRSDKE